MEQNFWGFASKTRIKQAHPNCYILLFRAIKTSPPCSGLTECLCKLGLRKELGPKCQWEQPWFQHAFHLFIFLKKQFRCWTLFTMQLNTQVWLTLICGVLLSGKPSPFLFFQWSASVKGGMQPSLTCLPHALGGFCSQCWTTGSMQGLWTIPALLGLPVTWAHDCSVVCAFLYWPSGIWVIVPFLRCRAIAKPVMNNQS